MSKSPAQVAFEAYSDAVGVTFSGALMPPWDKLTDKVRRGWEVAVQSIIPMSANPEIVLSVLLGVVRNGPKTREAAIFCDDLEKLIAYWEWVKK